MTDTARPAPAFFAIRRGPLSDDEIVAGMHFCYCNACDLFDDAKILLDAGRSARALGICVLCLEELAKIPLLSNAVFLRGKDASVWRRFWDALSSHKLKQDIWSVYGKTFLPESRRQKYYSRLYPTSMPSLEKMKQMSFYVDFFEKGPVRPTVLFRGKDDFINYVFQMSADRLKAFHPLHSTLRRSRKVLEMTSRIEFVGLSDEELLKQLFESIDRIKNDKHAKQ